MNTARAAVVVIVSPDTRLLQRHLHDCQPPNASIDVSEEEEEADVNTLTHNATAQ